jgi:hypothetical protein
MLDTFYFVFFTDTHATNTTYIESDDPIYLTTLTGHYRTARTTGHPRLSLAHKSPMCKEKKQEILLKNGVPACPWIGIRALNLSL